METESDQVALTVPLGGDDSEIPSTLARKRQERKEEPQAGGTERVFHAGRKRVEVHHSRHDDGLMI